VVAATTGVAGIFLIIGMSLAVATAVMVVGRKTQ
jgi:hypothetical protein